MEDMKNMGRYLKKRGRNFLQEADEWEEEDNVQ